MIFNFDKKNIGLGNVDNTSDMDKPVSTAVQSMIDVHTLNKNNPHSVTKAQVGLSNVDNTSDVNKPISTAQQVALNTLSNRISVIGETLTVDGSASVSAQTDNAGTTVAEITFSKGMYIVLSSVDFPTNSSGYRRMSLFKSRNLVSPSLGRSMTSNAAVGITTSLQMVSVIEATTDVTYYLNVQHSAGTALDVTAQIQAVRII